MEPIHRVAAFELGDDRDVAVAVAADDRLGFADVFGRLHEGERHGVNAEGEAVHEVLLVFFGKRGQRDGLAGQGEALARGDDAVVVGFELEEPVLAVFDHPELEGAVSEHEAIALFEFGENFGVIEGDIRELVIAHQRGGAEQQLIALEHVQRAFIGEGADTDLGAREVLKDRDGRLVDDFQFADHLDEVDEGGTVAVGEIKAENPDASRDQFGKNVTLVGRGADGCQNFGFHQGILLCRPFRAEGHGSSAVFRR